MMTLNDGRSELWQWDTGRKLTVDADCTQVHFSNKFFGRSVDVDVFDGTAEIPDVLLQVDKDLLVWAFVGTAENGYTKISKVFKVNKRNKPADYVFTTHEQTTLEEIKEKIEYLESIQDPDAIKNAVDEYLANNPIQIDEKDPTVPDWAKQTTKPKYTATEVGAVAKVNGVKPDANGNVEITIPGSGGNVAYDEAQNLTDAQKAQARENIGAQPKGNYLTEVPEGYAKKTDIPSLDGYAKTTDIPSLDGYAKSEDVPTDEEIIQLIEEHAPEPSGGGIAVTGATVGQTVKISAVDENGVPTAWLPTDFPSGGGSGSGGSDVWDEIFDITLSEDTSTVILSQDKNGNAFSLKKVYMKFVPAYGADNKTSGVFRVMNEAGTIDSYLDATRTLSILLYIDEVHVIMSKHYDGATGHFDTYAIKTHQLSRINNGTPISKFTMEYPNVMWYAGTKIAVWGVRA